jgi:hypothetical protein
VRLSLLDWLSRFLRPRKIIEHQAHGGIRPTGRLVAIKIAGQAAQSGDVVQVRVRERAVVIKRTEGTVTAIRITDDHTQNLAADIHDDGTITLLVTGHPSVGEDVVPRVAATLQDRLRLDGQDFQTVTDLSRTPAQTERGVDCELTTVDGQVIQIQVVRADLNQSLWRALSSAGRASAKYSVAALVEALKQVIALRARRIAVADRRALTLALDATIVGSHAFQCIIDAFRTEYGAWVRELGFSAVWCVGPTASLTWRLDV